MEIKHKFSASKLTLCSKLKPDPFFNIDDNILLFDYPHISEFVAIDLRQFRLTKTMIPKRVCITWPGFEIVDLNRTTRYYLTKGGSFLTYNKKVATLNKDETIILTEDEDFNSVKLKLGVDTIDEDALRVLFSRADVIKTEKDHSIIYIRAGEFEKENPYLPEIIWVGRDQETS